MRRLFNYSDMFSIFPSYASAFLVIFGYFGLCSSIGLDDHVLESCQELSFKNMYFLF